MDKLSIVLPAYNEEPMIEKTCTTLSGILEQAGINYELVFVDDGSSDRTWNEIEKNARKNNRIKGVHFSRNFGKEAAIYAGLAQAGGNAVAVMDCDLQHPPAVLLEMYKLWKEGFEVIEGKKSHRGKESLMHKKSAGLFYGLMSAAIQMDMNDTSDFKLLDRKAVNAILSMPEQNMFFRAVTSWIGFRTTEVEFEVQERVAGESKWSTWSLVKYAFTNIVSFTTVPLQFVSIAGILCFICSVLLILYSLFQYFCGYAVEGYTTTIIVLLFIGSGIMMSLGIIGYYIARIYEEVKKRPRYIISSMIHNMSEREVKNEETDNFNV